jgi:hypothetical protein
MKPLKSNPNTTTKNPPQNQGFKLMFSSCVPHSLHKLQKKCDILPNQMQLVSNCTLEMKEIINVVNTINESSNTVMVLLYEDRDYGPQDSKATSCMCVGGTCCVCFQQEAQPV